MIRDTRYMTRTGGRQHPRGTPAAVAGGGSASFSQKAARASSSLAHEAAADRARQQQQRAISMSASSTGDDAGSEAAAGICAEVIPGTGINGIAVVSKAGVDYKATYCWSLGPAM